MYHSLLALLLLASLIFTIQGKGNHAQPTSGNRRIRGQKKNHPLYSTEQQRRLMKEEKQPNQAMNGGEMKQQKEHEWSNRNANNSPCNKEQKNAPPENNNNYVIHQYSDIEEVEVDEQEEIIESVVGAHRQLCNEGGEQAGVLHATTPHNNNNNPPPPNTVVSTIENPANGPVENNVGSTATTPSHDAQFCTNIAHQETSNTANNNIYDDYLSFQLQYELVITHQVSQASLYTTLQQHLQRHVAPRIAGCSSNLQTRRNDDMLVSTIQSVLFDYPFELGTCMDERAIAMVTTLAMSSSLSSSASSCHRTIIDFYIDTSVSGRETRAALISNIATAFQNVNINIPGLIGIFSSSAQQQQQQPTEPPRLYQSEQSIFQMEEEQPLVYTQASSQATVQQPAYYFPGSVTGIVLSGFIIIVCSILIYKRRATICSCCCKFGKNHADDLTHNSSSDQSIDVDVQTVQEGVGAEVVYPKQISF